MELKTNFMLEISPKCWSLQPNECELVGLEGGIDY